MVVEQYKIWHYNNPLTNFQQTMLVYQHDLHGFIPWSDCGFIPVKAGCTLKVLTDVSVHIQISHLNQKEQHFVNNRIASLIHKSNSKRYYMMKSIYGPIKYHTIKKKDRDLTFTKHVPLKCI